MNKGVSFHKHLYCFGVNKIEIDFLTKIYIANSLSFCIFNYVLMAGCINMSKLNNFSHISNLKVFVGYGSYCNSVPHSIF